MLTLNGDRVLMADSRNSKMKMIDLRTNKLMFEVSLQSQPQSMCILSGERLAVCLPNKGRIQFLKTLGQLSLEEDINVYSRCLAIGYHNGRLIVSYTGGKFEIMDMGGNVVKTIDKDDSRQSIFGKPSHLEVVSEDKTAVIYVSDSSKSTITKLDMNLNILRTFKDPALKAPEGITAVGNQLLVCGWGSNNIMCMDLPSGKMTQLLGKVEGIERPRTVSYNHKQNHIYVTFDTSNSVKVYKEDQTLN
ncbi:uncharacterized protein LOC128238986 [Mya arenaria]|uniref:uncharacterized protein LOC128238986 n=1 Tax=Mya arenaria TaxID=6604 RepID=UPI0022DF3C28|nr:uncharacterized protein LOC128238986 [Mya arenaria]